MLVKTTEGFYETRISGFHSDDFEIRYLSSSVGVQPSPVLGYSLPRDMTDLATGSDPHKLIDFLRLQGQVDGEPDSDSD